jgi:hypothetical protein
LISDIRPNTCYSFLWTNLLTGVCLALCGDVDDTFFITRFQTIARSEQLPLFAATTENKLNKIHTYYGKRLVITGISVGIICNACFILIGTLYGAKLTTSKQTTKLLPCAAIPQQ